LEAIVAEPKVEVETVKFEQSGSRQIRTKTSTTELLQDRRPDIEAAVREASSIIQDSVAKVEDKPGWRLKTLEAKFGLTLAAEAGVILSKVSAEASFEVTVTIERH
jgi:Trypsin-co-occurring domain 1